MKNRWMDRCLYESPYHLTLCTTEKQFRRELKTLDLSKSDWPNFTVNDHSHAACHWFSSRFGQICIVCIRPNRKRTIHQINALIVHECVHLWQAIKEHIGEREPSKEFEAYAIQSLVQGLMLEYERQTK